MHAPTPPFRSNKLATLPREQPRHNETPAFHGLLSGSKPLQLRASRRGCKSSRFLQGSLMNITQPRGASTVSRRQRVGLLDRAAVLGVPLRAFAGAARITLGKGARDQMPRLRLVGQGAASLEGSTGHAYQVQSAGQGRTFDRGHQVGVRLCEGALSRAEEEHSSLARDLRAPQSVHGARRHLLRCQ
jgi:hypothetical protein